MTGFGSFDNSACVRSETVACGCSDWNCYWAAGDGHSPAAAAAGVPTPASGPGTPLPEKTTLVLDSVGVCDGSTSGGKGSFCPLTWVSNSVGPARPLGNPTGGEPAGPGVPGPPLEEGFPSGDGGGGNGHGPSRLCRHGPGFSCGRNTRSCRCGVRNGVSSSNGDDVV